MFYRKRYVNYKCFSRKTGQLLQSGGIYVEADDATEAEGIAYSQLKRNPPVQSTEGVDIEIECKDW